jgi:hypothetical protein
MPDRVLERLTQYRDEAEALAPPIEMEEIALERIGSGWVRPVVDRARPRRGWLVAIAVAAGVLVVGMGAFFLFSGAPTVDDAAMPAPAPSTTAVPPTTAPPATVPSTTVPAEAVVPFPPPELEVPLSEAVPGFSDTIVWSAQSDNGRSVMRWRASEPMAELLLPREDTEDPWDLGDDLDASGNWVAHVVYASGLTVEAVPTGPGEPSRREIVAHDVRGAAVWHDTEPGHLAWLECPSSLVGPTTLVTLDVSDPSADSIRVRSFDQGCRTGCWGVYEPCVTLVRWGSTGVWVTKYPEDWEAQRFEDTEGQDVIESVLVDADGAEIATVSDALMIAMSPDGTSVWQSGIRRGLHGHFVLSPDGQQRSTLPGLDDGETLRGAWWSPDGTRLAMWRGGGTLRTVDLVSGEVITEIAGPPLDGWGGSLAWSTDSRFLVYEAFHGPISPGNVVLVIHDTATNTTTEIPLSGDVADIRVR